MKVALIGTRGVPARYGGFETAVEEVGRRLVERGHEVTVYCRRTERGGGAREHLGMRLVQLPAMRRRSLETLSHTALSVVHEVAHGHHEVAVVFNAANSVFLPALRLRRTPVATHVDGLEWRRAKWGRLGQSYYRLAEALSVRWSDALVADAAGIADYYRDEFGIGTTEISYGAPILTDVSADRLHRVSARPRAYHLVVARFEPENHVDLAIEGYLASEAKSPLLVVGSAPYRSAYIDRIEHLVASDARVRLVGAVWDQELLNQLYAHAITYVHGHSVGGTNPSLLRAMGAGASVVGYDTVFNREVLADAGQFFTSAAELAALLTSAEHDTETVRDLGRAAQDRATTAYDWDLVAKQYELMCLGLLDGHTQRGTASGRRSPASTWRSDRDNGKA